jgi:hypothetical protein
MPEAAGDRSTALALCRLLAAAVVAMVAGCSSVRLGYDNADTLLYFKLDRYVDLSGAQSQFVRERLHALFAWHRATQLPGYAEFIEAAGRRVDGRVTAADVDALNLEINRRLLSIGDQAANDLATLALTLEPPQVDRLERKLAEDETRARDEASGAGRRAMEQRIKRSLARTEEWFGSVSAGQREFIRATLAQRPDHEETWLHERAQRRSDLLKVVRRIQSERPGRDTAAQWIRDYFASIAEPPEAERRARLQELRRDNADMVAGLVNAATPEQKTVLKRKLRGYADDFTALAAARPARS